MINSPFINIWLGFTKLNLNIDVSLWEGRLNEVANCFSCVGDPGKEVRKKQ